MHSGKLPPKATSLQLCVNVPNSVRMTKSIRKKLVIVGDGACGKTCLLLVFCKDYFPESYIPTLFDTFLQEIEVDQKKVTV